MSYLSPECSFLDSSISSRQLRLACVWTEAGACVRACACACACGCAGAGAGTAAGCTFSALRLRRRPERLPERRLPPPPPPSPPTSPLTVLALGETCRLSELIARPLWVTSLFLLYNINKKQLLNNCNKLSTTLKQSNYLNIIT